MRTETLHKRASTSGTPPAVADGTSTVGHRSPPLLPHHAVTDPIASCLAAVETDSAADEEEPHPSAFSAALSTGISPFLRRSTSSCALRIPKGDTSTLGYEMLGIRFSGYTRFLERPGSLQLSQVQVLIVVSSLP